MPNDVDRVPGEFVAGFVVPGEVRARRLGQIVGEEGLLDFRRRLELLFHPRVRLADPLVGGLEELVLAVELALEFEDTLARADARTQLVFVEWLGDEVVGTRLDALDHIARVRAHCQQDGVEAS